MQCLEEERHQLVLTPLLLQPHGPPSWVYCVEKASIFPGMLAFSCIDALELRVSDALWNPASGKRGFRIPSPGSSTGTRSGPA